MNTFISEHIHILKYSHVSVNNYLFRVYKWVTRSISF